MKTFQLNNGELIPAVGFGVFQIPNNGPTYEATLAALKAGYRHIDTAAGYMNESDVGKAIKESGIDRKDIYITSKLWLQDYGYENAKKGIENSLKALNVDYIDFNMLTAQLKIDLAKSFRDNGTHMNYLGAKKVTDYLGAYIAENYNLADLRGDKSYSYWNDSYNNFVVQMRQTDEKQREKALERKRNGKNKEGHKGARKDKV